MAARRRPRRGQGSLKTEERQQRPGTSDQRQGNAARETAGPEDRETAKAEPGTRSPEPGKPTPPKPRRAGAKAGRQEVCGKAPGRLGKIGNRWGLGTREQQRQRRSRGPGDGSQGRPKTAKQSQCASLHKIGKMGKEETQRNPKPTVRNSEVLAKQRLVGFASVQNGSHSFPMVPNGAQWLRIVSNGCVWWRMVPVRAGRGYLRRWQAC